MARSGKPISSDLGFGSRPISFDSLPPLLILDTNVSSQRLHWLEEACDALGASITYDPKEARIFAGRITQPKRAAFELRAKGIWTEAADDTAPSEPPMKKLRRNSSYARHDRSSDSSSSSDDDGSYPPSDSLQASSIRLPDLKKNVVVLKLAWLERCLESKSLEPLTPYQIYYGRIIEKPDDAKTPSPRTVRYVRANPEAAPSQSTLRYRTANRPSGSQTPGSSMFSRAQADASSAPHKGHPLAKQPRRRFDEKSAHPLTHSPPQLIRTSTSEFEETLDVPLPEPPAWVKSHVLYACCRHTPANSPNQAFINQLFKIKEARQLTLDQIGVRAYSTSIASLLAYPYQLRSPKEVLELPGCENKIAALFSEWQHSADTDSDRHLKTVRDLESDMNLRILRRFFNIWGVGAETARKLYFDRGFKDLDDVVEYGWKDLTRVQQIGVKYYDEFEDKIPREEVEQIAGVIQRHARICRDIPESAAGTSADIVCVIVGGYRRGKSESGDVDVILSHRDESITDNLVSDVIASLEEEAWITHTLVLHMAHSGRGQSTLPYASDGHHSGHGFDSLDKALVVWQDPRFLHPWTGLETDTVAEMVKAEQGEESVKNANSHRRVDIIISPWRTIGCAVLGWSGATTFERDVRRWCKNEKGWKFDSSGVRDRATGRVIDLESGRDGDLEDTWEARERRLMEGLGIGWRPPIERCTG